MKNDFDFIKDKVENSGVNAPAHMDEDWARAQLADRQPQVIALDASAAQGKKAERSKRRRTGRVTAIAAAVVAVAVLGTALTVHFTRNRAVQPTRTGEVSAVTGLIRFSSYDEVRDAVDQLQESTQRYIARTSAVEEYAFAEDAEVVGKSSADGVPSANGGSKGISYAGTDELTAGEPMESDSHSDTYKQVDGVDEADRVKTDGRYIYIADSVYSDADDNYISRISVFPARPGVTDPILSIIPGENYFEALPPATGDEATPDEPEDHDPGKADDVMIHDFYIKDNRMVILCTVDYSYDYDYTEVTRAYVYDVADMSRVRLLDTFTQSGSYTSSRMIGDTLYLVTNEYELSDIPCCGRGATPDEIPADCIYSVEHPSEESFLIVSAYDTLDYTAATDSKAVLGLGSDVYCSRNNLYITAYDYVGYYMTYDVGVNEDGVAYTTGGAVSTPKTKIFKVSLHDGVSFVAYGEVEGYTNNQYSFDESDGYLRVATTSYNEDYEDINHLFILDGDLEPVGSVTGFAETESIKAVRYVGDTAYVITYEQTDPLFVIDLSSPTAPVILGEVKISGFSTMLVPVDDSTILGLGVNTGEYDYTSLEVQDGFKLALFDVSNKSHPQVLDSRSYVNYNSEVMYNPKALVYNADRDDYLVPLDYYYFNTDDYDYEIVDDYDWERYYESHVEQYGAVLNFRVEGGRIVETELHITPHTNISRCAYVGDTVYAIYFDESGAHIDSFNYR